MLPTFKTVYEETQEEKRDPAFSPLRVLLETSQAKRRITRLHKRDAYGKLLELLDNFSQANPSSAINPFKITAGPWALSDVCKKWNSIVTTNATLWTNIAINTSPKAMNIWTPYIRFLLDVLRHSQQPLSIRFVEDQGFAPFDKH